MNLTPSVWKERPSPQVQTAFTWAALAPATAPENSLFQAFNFSLGTPFSSSSFRICSHSVPAFFLFWLFTFLSSSSPGLPHHLPSLGLPPLLPRTSCLPPSPLPRFPALPLGLPTPLPTQGSSSPRPGPPDAVHLCPPRLYCHHTQWHLHLVPEPTTHPAQVPASPSLLSCLK